MSIREDAQKIIDEALLHVQPRELVTSALQHFKPPEGKLVLVAAGKAAWAMAKAAADVLGNQIDQGIVITKYEHLKGPISNFRLWEAGHPVSDENSYEATREALDLVQPLTDKDAVLFLLSGGGSALFEMPKIPSQDWEAVNKALLACGASITEINTVRKRFSSVKGGGFAQECAPAQVFSIILSDVLGDRPDMIASGPACVDSSTAEEAQEIARRYHLPLTGEMARCLQEETPKHLENVETHVAGSVRQLCASTEKTCIELGYKTLVLTDSLCCIARDAGSFLASIASFHAGTDHPLAFIAGGETVVRLTGNGLGGRNQEIVLAAAEGIAGLPNVGLFSLGSDGTDGPTDAAGGYCDGTTKEQLAAAGIDSKASLENNDAYHALKAVDSLIFTGPTGTNVNDVTVLLIR